MYVITQVSETINDWTICPRNDPFSKKKAATTIDQRKTNLEESGQCMCKFNSDMNKGAKEFGEPEPDKSLLLSEYILCDIQPGVRENDLSSQVITRDLT